MSGHSRPAPDIESGGIRGGQLLLGLQPPTGWFIAPGVIDLATGATRLIPLDIAGDALGMAWTEDGQVLTALAGFRSSLWKFQPQGK